MKKYNINGFNIVFHPVQNIIMISTQQEISRQQINDIVTQIASNKAEYNVQDNEMCFDAFSLSQNKLHYYPHDENGEVITESSLRTLDDDGLFHFYFSPSEDEETERFILRDTDYFYIEEMNEASEIDQNSLKELIPFLRENHSQHFIDWELDEASEEELSAHIQLLISSSSNFYTVRNEQDNSLVAISGFSVTSDNKLCYQTITVTKENMRKQGIILALLQHVTNKFPEALMTAYFVNARIRNALGKQCITSPGENSIPAKSNYLQKKFQERGLAFEHSAARYCARR